MRIYIPGKLVIRYYENW